MRAENANNELIDSARELAALNDRIRYCSVRVSARPDGSDPNGNAWVGVVEVTCAGVYELTQDEALALARIFARAPSMIYLLGRLADALEKEAKND